MPDTVNATTRSRMMAGIRSKNTGPELLIRRLLHRDGFRYRIHVKNLPGCPDVVLPKYKAVVFVHGCFWHGHDCPLFRPPKSRTDYWSAKIDKNRVNDAKAINALIEMGWRVCIIWECAIRAARQDPDLLSARLKRWLTGESAFYEERA
jgi:DNA mismatch endonuclease, patch repair protein